ncbi:unnamed protein product [Lampetra planeri]
MVVKVVVVMMEVGGGGFLCVRAVNDTIIIRDESTDGSRDAAIHQRSPTLGWARRLHLRGGDRPYGRAAVPSPSPEVLHERRPFNGAGSNSVASALCGEPPGLRRPQDSWCRVSGGGRWRRLVRRVLPIVTAGRALALVVVRSLSPSSASLRPERAKGRAAPATSGRVRRRSLRAATADDPSDYGKKPEKAEKIHAELRGRERTHRLHGERGPSQEWGPGTSARTALPPRPRLQGHGRWLCHVGAPTGTSQGTVQSESGDVRSESGDRAERATGDVTAPLAHTDLAELTEEERDDDDNDDDSDDKR